MSRVEQLVKELPPELHGQAEDFLQFLIERHGKPRRHPLSEFRGALEDVPGDSVQLQHQIVSDWYQRASSRLERNSRNPDEPEER